MEVQSMACQIFQWLLAREGPTTLQHALVGIGCLLTYDLVSRMRKRRKYATEQADTLPVQAKPSDADSTQWRRAA
jgi:hypothetical protein